VEPLFEHRVSLGGYETRVLELEGEGPPLLLLHGYADSADTWRVILGRLGRADRRAVAVDLPGFATAARLRPGKVLPQLDRFVAAAAGYAAGDSGRPIVVGNSLGGTLALRAAQHWEELELAGVVPVAPAGFDMAAWFALIERNPILQVLLAVRTPVPEPVVRETVGRVYRLLAFARPAEIERSVVEAFTSHHRDRATVVRYLRTARRLLPELASPYQLELIGCPVLLVWGDRDRLVSPRGADQVAATLPDTRVELLAGCGHCPQVEAADRLAELLLDFPQALPRAA
jgi:pimeloyl-ACP methyl ester carboxylesterase